MRCELYVRIVFSLIAPVIGACEAVFAHRANKGPSGFVRDRAVVDAHAQTKEAAFASARVLSPWRPADKRGGPTQSVRLRIFCPPCATSSSGDRFRLSYA